jgi:hypothetical protein
MLVGQLSLLLLVIFAADAGSHGLVAGRPAAGVGAKRRHSIPRFDGNRAGDPGVLASLFYMSIPGPASGQLGLRAPVDAATKRGCRHFTYSGENA